MMGIALIERVGWIAGHCGICATNVLIQAWGNNGKPGGNSGGDLVAELQRVVIATPGYRFGHFQVLVPERERLPCGATSDGARFTN